MFGIHGDGFVSIEMVLYPWRCSVSMEMFCVHTDGFLSIEMVLYPWRWFCVHGYVLCPYRWFCIHGDGSVSM